MATVGVKGLKLVMGSVADFLLSYWCDDKQCNGGVASWSVVIG